MASKQRHMPAYIRLVSAMKRSGALSYVDSVDFEASGNSLLTLSRNRNVINKTSLHLHTVKSPNYEGRTESHEQLFLHANWEHQTKESAVVDGTSCCVILECLVTSIACIT